MPFRRVLHDISWDRDVKHLIAVVAKAVWSGEEKTVGRGTETIRVRRQQALQPIGRFLPTSEQDRLYVYLDDKKVASLGPNQVVELVGLETGPHKIEINTTDKEQFPYRLVKTIFDQTTAEVVVGGGWPPPPKAELSLNVRRNEVNNLVCGYDILSRWSENRPFIRHE
jgi:hypothetical protein